MKNGNDYEYFQEDDSFQISIFGKQQRNKIVLSLKEQSLLTMLITLYKSDFAYNDFYANHVSSFYTPKVYERLSIYIFSNLFQLPALYFSGNLDEVYCILFTCVALSDSNFVCVTSKGLNGGVVSII